MLLSWLNHLSNTLNHEWPNETSNPDHLDFHHLPRNQINHPSSNLDCPQMKWWSHDLLYFAQNPRASKKSRTQIYNRASTPFKLSIQGPVLKSFWEILCCFLLILLVLLVPQSVSSSIEWEQCLLPTLFLKKLSGKHQTWWQDFLVQIKL